MNDRVRIPGHVDNRHGNARSFETIPQVDARSVVQVDVENDASRSFKINLILKRLCRRKQHGFVSMPPKQTLESLK